MLILSKCLRQPPHRALGELLTMFCFTPPRLVWVLGDKMESTWLKKQPKHSSKSTSNILEKSTKSGPKSSPKCYKIEVWGGLGRLLGPIGASWPCFGTSWGCFGASWARLGRLRGILGGVLGRSGAVLVTGAS